MLYIAGLLLIIIFAIMTTLAIDGINAISEKNFWKTQRRIVQSLRVDGRDGHFVDITIRMHNEEIKATMHFEIARAIAESLDAAAEQPDSTLSSVGPYWNPRVLPGGKSDVIK